MHAKLTVYSLLISAVFFNNLYAADVFGCEKNMPSTLQTPSLQNCTQAVPFTAETENILFVIDRFAYNRILESKIIANNNMGGAIFHFPNGVISFGKSWRISSLFTSSSRYRKGSDNSKLE